MFIRPCYRRKGGKKHAYWALVESYRTERGPRQRVVAYIGQADAPKRRGVKKAAQGNRSRDQRTLFRDEESEWVEVDAANVRVENNRSYGACWLGLEIVRKLGLNTLLERLLPQGREDVPWSVMAQVLILSRLQEPSSELRIAEHLYESTALSELLGIPDAKVNIQRLYRTMDHLLPLKEQLESHLKERMGDLFELDYDLLLYDVTSTYFEGEVKGNPKAQRGHSRDQRGDCKQLCIGLVVTRSGIPLGYEVFEGNRHDSRTVQEIVTTMEARYGRSNRIWVMDRGMVSEENMTFLRDGRRYIIGTPRGSLRKYEKELLKENWQEVHAGLQVKMVPSPDGDETFILCRSEDRQLKEEAICKRFMERMEEGLAKIVAGCQKRRRKPEKVLEQIGRLKQKNSRAARLYDITVTQDESGRAIVTWKKQSKATEWAELSQGCYMLRSNVTDWSAEELWQAYIHLTDAEEAFRIHKHDMTIRPIWHQKEDRAEAHILICFLAYVLWKTLGQMCKGSGLGDEPRRVFDEFSRIQTVDVVLPTRSGIDIRKRCVTRPTEHQQILLSHLKLELPAQIKLNAM